MQIKLLLPRQKNFKIEKLKILITNKIYKNTSKTILNKILPLLPLRMCYYI